MASRTWDPANYLGWRLDADDMTNDDGEDDSGEG